jgi:hypothetical protein
MDPHINTNIINNNNDPPEEEEALYIDNSDDEETNNLNHQAILRQQAHAPVGIGRIQGGDSALSRSFASISLANPNAYSSPRLEELVNNTSEGSSIPPEHAIHNSLSSEEQEQVATPASWSIVDTSGGTPPSARSRECNYEGLCAVMSLYQF